MSVATGIVEAPPADEERLARFVGTVVDDLAAAYGGVMLRIGHALGLYAAMADAGPLSAGELAARTECRERYIREWLNSQAAGGYVLYHPASATYELAPEQRTVLADQTSPYFMPRAWDVPVSMLLDEEQSIDAFRSGAGIAWGDHNPRLFDGVAAFYRNGYEANLVQSWIPSLDGVQEKLDAGALVADIGCGHGHSTVTMATAYPRSRFIGLDSHEASIHAAREAADAAGVGDRVEFRIGTATDHGLVGVDLVCFFDCFHDLGDPVGAAAAARAALAADGSVMLVEPAAGDRVEDNLNPVGRIYYAASTTLCCANAIADGADEPLGAQAGEARLADACRRGGLTEVRRTAETPFNIVLEARCQK